MKKFWDYLILAIVVGLAGGMLGGWIWNIVKIFQSDAFNGTVIARVLGVFIPPVGGIMGWF